MDLEKFCQKWLSAWTGNDPERLRNFYSIDAYYRDPAKPDGIHGDELLPYFRKLLARNPNWIWEPLEILKTHSGFCLKWKATIPVGNRTIFETGLDIIELNGEQIIRNEVWFDRAAILKALEI